MAGLHDNQFFERVIPTTMKLQKAYEQEPQLRTEPMNDMDYQHRLR